MLIKPNGSKFYPVDDCREQKEASKVIYSFEGVVLNSGPREWLNGRKAMPAILNEKACLVL